MIKYLIKNLTFNACYSILFFFPNRYPVIRMPYDAPFYVGGLLGDVKYNKSDGKIWSIGAIRLVFNMKQEPSMNFYSIQFRDVMADYLLSFKNSQNIKVTFGDDDSLNEGLKVNLFSAIN